MDAGVIYRHGRKFTYLLFNMIYILGAKLDAVTNIKTSFNIRHSFTLRYVSQVMIVNFTD